MVAVETAQEYIVSIGNEQHFVNANRKRLKYKSEIK